MNQLKKIISNQLVTIGGWSKNNKIAGNDAFKLKIQNESENPIKMAATAFNICTITSIFYSKTNFTTDQLSDHIY